MQRFNENEGALLLAFTIVFTNGFAYYLPERRRQYNNQQNDERIKSKESEIKNLRRKEENRFCRFGITDSDFVLLLFVERRKKGRNTKRVRIARKLH